LLPPVVSGDCAPGELVPAPWPIEGDDGDCDGREHALAVSAATHPSAR
jgi:hypothetical protein